MDLQCDFIEYALLVIMVTLVKAGRLDRNFVIKNKNIYTLQVQKNPNEQTHKNKLIATE